MGTNSGPSNGNLPPNIPISLIHIYEHTKRSTYLYSKTANPDVYEHNLCIYNIYIELRPRPLSLSHSLSARNNRPIIGFGEAVNLCDFGEGEREREGVGARTAIVSELAGS